MTTVYTKPNCPHCAATKRLMNQLGVEYKVIDFTKNPESLQFLKDSGFREAPVVITDDNQKWSGFKRDKIEALAKNDTEDVWGF